MLYGFYSAKQAIVGGVREWNTPDGRTVLTTEICTSNRPFGRWDDYVHCGEVVACLRVMHRGEIEKLLDNDDDECPVFSLPKASVIHVLPAGSRKLQDGDVWN